jgi:hypothetical protein
LLFKNVKTLPIPVDLPFIINEFDKNRIVEVALPLEYVTDVLGEEAKYNISFHFVGKLVGGNETVPPDGHDTIVNGRVLYVLTEYIVFEGSIKDELSPDTVKEVNEEAYVVSIFLMFALEVLLRACSK